MGKRGRIQREAFLRSEIWTESIFKKEIFKFVYLLRDIARNAQASHQADYRIRSHRLFWPDDDKCVASCPPQQT